MGFIGAYKALLYFLFSIQAKKQRIVASQAVTKIHFKSY